MSEQASTTQADEVTDVHDSDENLIGWAFLSDGQHEPAGTPMAAKFTGDECLYTQHESTEAALAHIRG